MFTLDINTTPLRVKGLLYESDRYYKLKYINSISPDFHIYEIVRDIGSSDKETLSFRFMVKTYELNYLKTVNLEQLFSFVWNSEDNQLVKYECVVYYNEDHECKVHRKLVNDFNLSFIDKLAIWEVQYVERTARTVTKYYWNNLTDEEVIASAKKYVETLNKEE